MRTTGPKTRDLRPRKRPNFRGTRPARRARTGALERLRGRTRLRGGRAAPAAQAAHSVVSQAHAGEAHVDPDEARSAGGSRTDRAPPRPAGRAARTAPSAGADALGRLPAAGQPPHAHGRAGRRASAISPWRWITKSIVPRPSKFRRLMLLAGRAARVRARRPSPRCRRRSSARRAPRARRSARSRPRSPGGSASPGPAVPSGAASNASCVARQASTTAATRISIESAKWPITQP